jgi:hypothetical protein
VRSGHNDRGLVIVVVDHWITHGENYESSRVVILVQHVVEQNFKAMGCSSARRGESCHRRIACLCDLTDRTRCVMCWNRFDSEVKEHMLSLGECLRVGSHLPNVFDRGTRYAVKRMAYLDKVLSKNREAHMACVARQPIKNGKNRSRGRVLNRDNQTIDIAILHCIERSCKAAKPDELPIGK